MTHSRPSRSLLRYHRSFRPLAQPGHLAVEIAPLVMSKDPGIEADGLGRSLNGSIGGYEDGPLIYPGRRRRGRTRLEPVVRGLRMDALASCPPGEIHLVSTVRERLFARSI